MVEEYSCLICGGLDNLYDNRDEHAQISPNEDPAFFDYSWEPVYQARPENPSDRDTESL